MQNLQRTIQARFAIIKGVATTQFSVIRGTLVLTGYKPDGDSVRFIPVSKTAMATLRHYERLRFSADGSVQLRLEAIDTPETHYAGEEQPLGIPARQAFLDYLGFTSVVFSASGSVTTAVPLSVPATIVSRMVEVHGRPVAYLFTDPAATFATKTITPSTTLLQKSANAHMLDTGAAYLTLYTSTPVSHRTLFVSLARVAAASGKGVWAEDASKSFVLSSQEALEPGEQLILPKLFRRCTDYLKAKDKGFNGDLLAWLKTAKSNGLTEDDHVWVGTQKTRLSQIITQKGQQVSCVANLLDLVFIEK
jgi:endonuclease YncB( thermonuclease family)